MPYVQSVTLIFYITGLILLYHRLRMGLRWEYTILAASFLINGITFYAHVIFNTPPSFHAATWSSILRLQGAIIFLFMLAFLFRVTTNRLR